MRKLILLGLVLTNCSTQNSDQIIELNLKNLELNDIILEPLDSSELEIMVQYELREKWDGELQFLNQFYPPSYVLDNEDDEKEKFVQRFLEKYNALWLPFSFQNEALKLILLKNGDSKDWAAKGYELRLFYPNCQEDRFYPIEIAR